MIDPRFPPPRGGGGGGAFYSVGVRVAAASCSSQVVIMHLLRQGPHGPPRRKCQCFLAGKCACVRVGVCVFVCLCVWAYACLSLSCEDISRVQLQTFSPRFVSPSSPSRPNVPAQPNLTKSNPTLAP